MHVEYTKKAQNRHNVNPFPLASEVLTAAQSLTKSRFTRECPAFRVFFDPYPAAGCNSHGCINQIAEISDGKAT